MMETYGWDGPARTVSEARHARAAAKAAEAKRVEDERRAALQPRIEAARRLAERGDVDGMNEFTRLLCEEHRITLHVLDPFPKWAAAYANPHLRRITVPMIKWSDPLEERFRKFADRNHEKGHILAGPCEGPRHRRDDSKDDAHRCVECERRAWEIAMTLVTFNTAMFEELRRATRWYREHTPAMEVVAMDSDAMMGSVTLAQHRLRRHMFTDRCDRQARVNAQIEREKQKARTV